jgi:WhiB family redox-sensing transcriptional regulator
MGRLCISKIPRRIFNRSSQIFVALHGDNGEYVVTIIEGSDWISTASCKKPGNNPDWWSDDATIKEQHKAMKICESCPAVLDCLMYAVNHKIPHGIWGGKKPGTRRKWAIENRFVHTDSRPIVQDLRKLLKDSSPPSVGVKNGTIAL